MDQVNWHRIERTYLRMRLILLALVVSITSCNGLTDISTTLEDNSDGNLTSIIGHPLFSDQFAPSSIGYLPGEEDVQFAAQHDASLPVPYSLNTNIDFEFLIRRKRRTHQTKYDKNGNEIIVMASLLPANDTRLFSIRRVRPAVELAIEKMNPLLARHNRTLVVKFRDSKCDIAEGMNELINFYIHDEIDVLLGPCCDYAIAPCARQVPFWNIPLLTAGGTSATFGASKNTTFYTMTRLGPNFQQLTVMLVKILTYYDWNKVRLVYEPSGERNVSLKHCHLAVNDLHYGLRAEAMVRNIQHDYEKFENVEEILNDTTRFLGLKFASKCVYID